MLRGREWDHPVRRGGHPSLKKRGELCYVGLDWVVEYVLPVADLRFIGDIRLEVLNQFRVGRDD